MTPEQSVIGAIIICIAGALVSLLTARNKDRRGLACVRFTAAAAVVMVAAVGTF